MNYREILYDTADRIATVTLNRPQRLNAWTPTIEREVRDAFVRASADPNVRVVILTGAGRGFCSGADLHEIDVLRQQATDLPDSAADFQTRYSWMPAIPKPVIAAINGPCAGLGMAIALYADLRFAGADAMFTTAFARRGLVAEHGIAWTLSRLVGPSNALDLLLSARKVQADEALRLGLVSRVVPTDELIGTARAYAAELCELVSPRSMAVIKRQAWAAQAQTLGAAIALADDEMEKSFASDDFREGIAHFLEKRSPKFTGE